MEAAIAQVTRQPVSALAAGRTDAGVHATGQVIAFDVEWKHGDDDLLRAINSRLPAAIALQTLWQQAGFHPRFDACWRQYAYRLAPVAARQPLLAGQVWQLLGVKLDLKPMQLAAAACLGEVDFAAFGSPPQAGSTNTVRQIFLSRWALETGRNGAIYTYRIRGTAFLYHMVRRLVGTMAQVGMGKLSPQDFQNILSGRDIARAKALAPPHGLVLESVGYPPCGKVDSSGRETQTRAEAVSLEGKK